MIPGSNQLTANDIRDRLQRSLAKCIICDTVTAAKVDSVNIYSATVFFLNTCIFVQLALKKGKTCSCCKLTYHVKYPVLYLIFLHIGQHLNNSFLGPVQICWAQITFQLKSNIIIIIIIIDLISLLLQMSKGDTWHQNLVFCANIKRTLNLAHFTYFIIFSHCTFCFHYMNVPFRWYFGMCSRIWAAGGTRSLPGPHSPSFCHRRY